MCYMFWSLVQNPVVEYTETYHSDKIYEHLEAWCWTCYCEAMWLREDTVLGLKPEDTVYFLFISSTILWCVFNWKCSCSCCLHIVTPYVQLRSVVIKLTLSSSLLTLMQGSAWRGGIRFGSREKMIPQKPRAISAPDVRGVLQACFGWIEQLTGWLYCMLLTERKKCSFSGLCQAMEANNQTAVMLLSEAQTECSNHGPVSQ